MANPDPSGALVPTYANLRWGAGAFDLFDYFKHPTRDVGGNPLFIFRHGGAGVTGYKGENNPANIENIHTLLRYLLDPARATHFDVACVETPQYMLGVEMGRGESLVYPDVIYRLQRCVQIVRMMAGDLGGNPALATLGGESYGGWMVLMATLLQPFLGGGGVRMERRRRFETRGWDSITKGVVNYNGLTDYRRTTGARAVSFAGATWNHGTLTLTKAGAFTNWFAQCINGVDQCLLTAGTNATLGTYTIASATANTLVLTSSPGATATALSGRVSTDAIQVGGISPALTGSVNVTQWNAVPKSIKAAMSPQAYAEANELRYLVPIYNIYGDQGTGNWPYANAYEFGSNIHDYHQGIDFDAAVRLKGRRSVNDTFARGTWEVASMTGDAISKRVYDWMAARILDP